MLSGVYCIVSNDSNVQEVYVGSTEDLNKRVIDHKNRCNNKNSPKYNYNVYQFIRENGGFDNWKFIWLEMFKTDDIIFLKQLEQIWMDSFPEELLLNGIRAYRTEEEKIEYHTEYNKKNRDILNEKNKVKVPCPKCSKSISKSHMARHLRESCKKNTI